MSADHRIDATGTKADLERTFCIAGLSVEARLALNSMIHLLNARTKHNWYAVDTINADVLFLGSDIDEGSERDLVARSSRIVRVAAYDSELPGTSTRLEYPFRVFQVLTVLEELAEQFNNPASHHIAKLARRNDSPEWNLFESLRTQLNFSSHGQWLTSRFDDGRLLYVRDNFSEYAGEECVHSDLASGRLPHSALAPTTPPCASLRRGPGTALLWQIGLHSGDGELSDSLDSHSHYQLTAWPDFGVVKAQRTHLRLTAILAASPHSRDQLVQAMHGELDEQAINRFFNACHASGLLHLVKSHVAAADTKNLRKQSSFMGSLVSRIRGKLGFSQHRTAEFN